MRPVLLAVGFLQASLGTECAPHAASQRPDESQAAENQLFGRSCAVLDDLDDDGRRELAIGSPTSWVTDGGTVRIHSGRTGALLRTLAPDPDDYGMYGYALAAVGDLDGDGVGELLVGAPNLPRGGGRPSGDGAVYVHSGRSGALLRRIGSPATDLERDGWIQVGPRCRFGESVHGFADLDRDGVRDLLVGGGAGPGPVAWVLSGADGSVLLACTGDDGAGHSLGCTVDEAGDVDADGVADVLLALQSNAPGVPGALRVCSGADGRVLHELKGGDLGPDAEGFGWRGGRIGSPGPPGGAAFYVISGGTYRWLSDDGPVLHLLGLGEDGLRVLRSVRGVWSESGSSLSVVRLGDVDGQGGADYAVVESGAPLRSALSESPCLDLVAAYSGLTGEALWTVADPTAGCEGWRAVCSGDVDGDGVDDVVCTRGGSPELPGALVVLCGSTGRRLLRVAEGE